jgi:hypothetical protein
MSRVKEGECGQCTFLCVCEDGTLRTVEVILRSGERNRGE